MLIFFLLVVFNVYAVVVVKPLSDMTVTRDEAVDIVISAKDFYRDGLTPVFPDFVTESLPPGLSSVSVDPTSIKTISTSSNICYDVRFSDDKKLAFVVDQSYLLQIVNVTSMAVIKTVSNTGHSGLNFLKSGPVQYVTTQTTNYNMRVVNVTNPDEAAVVGVMSMHNEGAGGQVGYIHAGDFNHLYATTYYSNDHVHFLCVDVEDKENPNIIKNIDLGDCGCSGSHYEGISGVGDFMYVEMGKNEHTKFLIFNVTDRKNPFVCGSLTQLENTGSGYHGIYYKDDYVYLSAYETALFIIDVSNKTNPVVISNYTTQSNQLGYIDVVGDYMYVVDNEDGVFIVNVRDKLNPYYVTKFANENGARIDVGPNIAIISDKLDGARFLYFGDRRIAGSPSVCGDYEVKVIEHGLDQITAPIITSFMIHVRAEGYIDSECTIFVCNGTLSNDTNRVCSGHGVCTKLESEQNGVDFSCQCQYGYYSSIGWGLDCDDFSCGLYHKDDVLHVCSGNGQCSDYNNCVCKKGYVGTYCSLWNCQGLVSTDFSVCSGSGKCIKPETCDCDPNRSGKNCETNLLYFTVMTPLLSVTGITFGVCCMSLIVCCFCVCVTLICVSCCSVCCLFVMNRGQKLRLAKFSKLRNVDLLLHEQEMEEDTSIAHLRIESAIFEIDMDEIKLSKLLGEGGSSSVVYRAKWHDKTVAFKCFKTRQVCGDQDSFDEFEREVSILGSVSHPNILQFYGCSLKPPRVGIVMEFCGNGDLQYYMRNKIELEDERIPFDEKIRFCNELISAMIYLHSRSIIHRDIKLENVLLNDSKTCKLMDFGLSKIVDRLSQQKTSNIGTSFYMAPELIESVGNYDEKVDSFAMGIMMYIIFSENFFPYGRDNTMNIEMKVAIDPNLRPDLKRMVGKVPKEHIKWLCQLLQVLWDHSPSVRPSFKKLSSLVRDGLGGAATEEMSGRPAGEEKKKEAKEQALSLENNVVEVLVVQEQGDNDEKILVSKEDYMMMKSMNEKLKVENEELRRKFMGGNDDVGVDDNLDIEEF